MVKLTINDKMVEVPEGTTVLEAARQAGIKVPTLCHYEAIKPYGGCRLCVVEITAGGRTSMTASCSYPVSEGIKVLTDTPEVLEARRLVIDLLWSRCPDLPILKSIALELGSRNPVSHWETAPVFSVTLCTRVCNEIEHRASSAWWGAGPNGR